MSRHTLRRTHACFAMAGGELGRHEGSSAARTVIFVTPLTSHCEMSWLKAEAWMNMFCHATHTHAEARTHTRDEQAHAPSHARVLHDGGR